LTNAILYAILVGEKKVIGVGGEEEGLFTTRKGGLSDA